MFLDFVAVFSECCDLGKVSNADDLVCRSDLFEFAPDYTGCDSADAAVDLIEDHKLIFAVRNPVTEKVEIENDTIKSKRGDHHGIGLLNVKAVVDKYGGDMVLSCDENEFKAVVIL